MGEFEIQFGQLWPHLNERGRRMLAATEAVRMGYGGVSTVSRVCGLSRVTITKGIQELSEPAMPSERVRREGAGRPNVEVKDPKLLRMLDELVEPLARGDPQIAVAMDVQEHTTFILRVVAPKARN